VVSWRVSSGFYSLVPAFWDKALFLPLRAQQLPELFFRYPLYPFLTLRLRAGGQYIPLTRIEDLPLRRPELLETTPRFWRSS